MKLLKHLAVLFSMVALNAIAADEPAKVPDAAGSAPTAAAPPAEATAPSASAGIDRQSDAGFTGKALDIKHWMEDLFDASRKVNSPNASEKSQARGKIEGALDWDRVAKDCLGAKNWKKQSAKNLSEFRSLLKDVIVRTAYTRMDKFWKGSSYKFEKFDIKGNTAKLPTKFIPRNGAPIVLEYYVDEKGGKHYIYDISYEDLRYSVNINEQLEAFLREGNFAKLLDKLRKRRDELAADQEPKKG